MSLVCEAYLSQKSIPTAIQHVKTNVKDFESVFYSPTSLYNDLAWKTFFSGVNYGAALYFTALGPIFKDAFW